MYLTSRAHEYVRLSSAALDAPYTGRIDGPNFAATEVILTIRPPDGMCGTTCWVTYKEPKTFTANVVSSISLVVSSVLAGNPVPALLTETSNTLSKKILVIERD